MPRTPRSLDCLETSVANVLSKPRQKTEESDRRITCENPLICLGRDAVRIQKTSSSCPAGVLSPGQPQQGRCIAARAAGRFAPTSRPPTPRQALQRRLDHLPAAHLSELANAASSLLYSRPPTPRPLWIGPFLAAARAGRLALARALPAVAPPRPSASGHPAVAALFWPHLALACSPLWLPTPRRRWIGGRAAAGWARASASAPAPPAFAPPRPSSGWHSAVAASFCCWGPDLPCAGPRRGAAGSTAAQRRVALAAA